MAHDKPIEAKFKLGQYAVLYFDLMGVRQSLFKDITYHSSEVSDEKQKEIDRTSDTILGFLNGIQELHDMFKLRPENLYAQSMIDSPQYADPKFRDEFLRQAKELSVGIQQGSGTTLLYVRDDGSEMTRMLISTWMAKLPLLILNAMSNGVTIRGCFTRGTGWEIRDNCLFGPVIHEAAEMEEHRADYSRIVVTSPFYSMCVGTDSTIQNITPNQNYECNPFRMFCVDCDGMVIYDYLGNMAIKILSGMYCQKGYGVEPLKKKMLFARSCVVENMKRHNKNARALEINQKLLSYIDYKTRTFLEKETK